MDWLYKINLEVSEEESWTGVINLCNSAIREINRIKPLIEKSKIDNKEIWVLQLEDILQDFEMRLLDENDTDLHTSIDECNYILENLYDLGDLKVNLNGEKRKFIWISKI